MTVYKLTRKNGKTFYRIDVYWEYADGRAPVRVRENSKVNTLRGAEAREREIRAALAERSWGKAAEAAATPTLAEFEARYFRDHVATLKASTVDEYKRMFRLHLIPHVGAKRLHEIAAEVPFLVATLRANKVRSPKRINNILSCLLTCLTKAAKWKVIDKHAVPEIEWLKVPQQKFDFFNFDEAARVINGSMREGTCGAMIRFAIHTGLRAGELRALRWCDLVNGQVVVSQSDWEGTEDGTKNHRIRSVPLNATAREAIESLRGGKAQGYVFRNAEGGKLKKGDMKWPLWRACDTAGVGRRVGWHVLRHTFASHLVMRGVALPAVQQLLGHATITMTMRYAHLAPGHLKSAVDAIA